MLLALLLAAGLLVASVLSYSLAGALIVHLLVWLVRTGYTERGFWKNVAVMMIVTLVTAGAHLVPIALWALAFLMIGEISTFEKALYLSAQNYTALGYGDVVLSERWQLLGPLEAINGLLLFGLSTAVMFAVLSRLVANRLGFQLGPPGEPPGGPAAKSANEPLSGDQGHAG